MVVRYRLYLESRHLAANTINQQLAAVRRLAQAADAGLLSPELAAGISRVKGVKQLGFRSGNWLSAEQSSAVLMRAWGDTMRAERDYAMLAMLFGCGFRRSELVSLELDDIQMRQGHWAVVDLIGKGGHIRTVPIPNWVKAALDQWVRAANVTEGKIFRRVARMGKVWGSGLSQNVVWMGSGIAVREQVWTILHRTTYAGLVRSCATTAAVSWSRFNSYSVMRRSQTPERYLGCKQNLGHPVNDLFDLRTEQSPDKDREPVVANGVKEAVEKVFEQGIECRHGGSKDDQPVCDVHWEWRYFFLPNFSGGCENCQNLACPLTVQ